MSGDLAAGLARFLSEEVGRAVTVSNLEPLSAGARRRNVAFDADLGGCVLRMVATLVPGAVQLLPVDVEAAVRELVREQGVPVPHVLAVCTDAGPVGEPFMLSERLDGETVPRRVLRLIHDHGVGARVGEQLGHAMAVLHAIDPTRASPALPGVAEGNPAARMLAEMESAVARDLPDRPVFALALRWLARHLPTAPDRFTLVHTDIRNGNLIVGPEGLRAVLDWEGTQRFGDPMRDVGWCALRMWRFGIDDREFGGFADRAAFLRGYTSAGGVFDPDRFRWWKIACTLGWGAALAAQTAAFLDGTVPSIVMAASGRRIPEIEWDLLMQLRPTGSR
ncbi:phosphotransferase family protein [Nocardia yunnanensis]|uniref:Phosphotransferase family protein n=1 Tax=Nocardia yunnanensis TaxID=2382165 RepID=A0A386ZJF5_9NOCA|nr:phosphotransferase family protein [Nocardia yunnanensis]AYF77520.1 phosphotransferase family protein [Nocardia yunnanensis]